MGKYAGLGIALEWWLKKQGKFKDAKVTTMQDENGDFKITQWEVLGVAQPTENNIIQILQDYNNSGSPLAPKSEKERLLSLLDDNDIKLKIKGIRAVP